MAGECINESRRNPGKPVSPGGLCRVAVLALLGTTLAFGQSLEVIPYSTGPQPLGVDVSVADNSEVFAPFVAVANSGGNSVSVFELVLSGTAPGPVAATPTTTISGVPSPYAVAGCNDTFGRALVTSPSQNSVELLNLVAGTLIGTAQTSPQPYSAACAFVSAAADSGYSGYTALVSSAADDTLMLFDIGTLEEPVSFTAITAISGVPGSSGYHGIAVFSTNTGAQLAAIAGTAANVVTIVNLSTYQVVTQIPIPSPMSVSFSGAYSNVPPLLTISSAANNDLYVYNANTLQLTETITDVSGPQDAIGTELGTFAVLGSGSVWASAPPGATATTVPLIQGAASVAAAAVANGVGAFFNVALVTATSSNSLYLIEQGPGAPSQFTVQNAASFASSQLAPGSLAAALVTTGTTQNFNASSVPLPTTLGGVTVNIGGSLTLNAATGVWEYSDTGSIQAGLLFAGPGQVNFQIPPGITPGNSVPVAITTAAGTTLLSTIDVAATAPGLFSVLENGEGQGAIQNQDYSQNLGTNPASPGSVIIIYATGAGTTDPALQAGQAAPSSPLIYTQAQPTVNIGGQTAQVQFSGLTPTMVGLWQINAVIPENITPGSAVPLFITANGVTSNTVTIAVQ